MTKRRSRNAVIADAPPVDTWPTCALESEQFQQRVTAITMYFQSYPLEEITEVTGIAFQRLSGMAKRCLNLAPDGRIFGFRALIPNARIATYTRTAPVRKASREGQGGMAGALQKLLLTYPDIETKLIQLINKKRSEHTVHEFRISARHLHRMFLALLKTTGVARTEWPFTTKSLGLRSISTYMHQVIAAHFSHAVMRREFVTPQERGTAAD